MLELLPIKHPLILTKKNSIDGIKRELDAVGFSKPYTLINYESVHKVDMTHIDFVWADEAHVAGGGVGKPSSRFKLLRKLCWDKPLLCSTATPYTETMNAAFYMFGISKYTPLKYTSFYKFHADYGIPSPIWINGRSVESYKKSRPELESFLEPWTVKMTQADAGIAEHIQAQDVVHKLTLQDSTYALIQKLKKDLVVMPFVCESEMQLLTYIHQAEAGAVLVGDEMVELPDNTFVDYIRERFGDLPEVGVLAHFQSTRWKIAKHLPNVTIYSSNASAEGCDLSHHKHLLVVNSDYSGSKFIQRMQRGVRLDMTEKREAHLLVAKGGISEQVYAQVSQKRSFTLSHFKKWRGDNGFRATNSDGYPQVS